MTMLFSGAEQASRRSSRGVSQGSGLDTGAIEAALLKPTVAGKFLQAGRERLWVKGVTYGTFAPGPDGRHFPSGERIRHDFTLMSRAGVNTVRTYTVPDR